MLERVTQLLRAGAYSQARRQAEMLLQGDLEPAQAAVAYRLAARACLGMEEPYAAVQFGERACELAKSSGAVETLAQAHFDCGCGYVNIGDTARAEEHLKAFDSLVAQAPVLASWRGLALYNLSIIHRQRKDWAGAIDALTQASVIFEAGGHQDRLTQARLDTAWCYLMSGNAGSAALHLERVADYVASVPDSPLAADLLTAQALYHRVAGDLAKSSRLCAEVISERPGMTRHHLAEACWVLGENALDLNRLEEASVFAALALDHAQADNWPSMMNLAGDLRRRVQMVKAPGA